MRASAERSGGKLVRIAVKARRLGEQIAHVVTRALAQKQRGSVAPKNDQVPAIAGDQDVRRG